MSKAISTAVCPCCVRQQVSRIPDPVEPYRCDGCGHRWFAAGARPSIDYRNLRERNAVQNPAHARKLHDRMADIAPLLRPGMRVLEIGCAEGSLGELICRSTSVRYTGIELSADAETAVKHLDRVIRLPAATIVGETFDLLLSFHVLEHLEHIAEEVGHWRTLLDKDGKLIVEVPYQSGHRLLDTDPNREHVHQFTPASIAALLLHAGFEIDRLDAGHWESSVYSNSLRVIARGALSREQRTELLLRHIRSRLSSPFIAWGIGGDFGSYIEPLLDSLPIAALIDSAAQRHGEHHGRLTVEAYDRRRHGELPILVCSVRYREDILRNLAALGIPSSSVVTLDDIFGTFEQ